MFQKIELHKEGEAPPEFCPVCGRRLIGERWETRWGKAFYGLNCYGHPLSRFMRRVLGGEAHYTYILNSGDVLPRYDKYTGVRVGL